MTHPSTAFDNLCRRLLQPDYNDTHELGFQAGEYAWLKDKEVETAALKREFLEHIRLILFELDFKLNPADEPLLVSCLIEWIWETEVLRRKLLMKIRDNAAPPPY